MSIKNNRVQFCTLLFLLTSNSTKVSEKAAESISYSGLSLVSYVIIAFFFALGIWLGIWMSQLEDKYK